MRISWRQWGRILPPLFIATAIAIEQWLHLFSHGRQWWETVLLIVAAIIVADYPHVYLKAKRHYKGFPEELKSKLGSLDETTLPFPKQIETIFVQGVGELIDHTLKFRAQKNVPEVTLHKQYEYASRIAAHYRSNPIAPIGATALDLPSEFITNHKEYFRIQENLKSDRRTFVAYAKFELRNLKDIRTAIDRSDDGGVQRHPDLIPDKARIVVISYDALTEEIGKPAFWEFIEWHVRNDFALKFLVRAQTDEEPYETHLKNAVVKEPSETIDDFIVYGDQCVFGRINPEPDAYEQVTLGFHYVSGVKAEHPVAARYAAFFRDLWRDEHQVYPDAHTVSELWLQYPALREAVRCAVTNLDHLIPCYDAAIKRRA